MFSNFSSSGERGRLLNRKILFCQKTERHLLLFYSFTADRLDVFSLVLNFQVRKTGVCGTMVRLKAIINLVDRWASLTQRQVDTGTDYSCHIVIKPQAGVDAGQTRPACRGQSCRGWRVVGGEGSQRRCLEEVLKLRESKDQVLRST